MRINGPLMSIMGQNTGAEGEIEIDESKNSAKRSL
jgi:hypothetical protein